MQKTFSPLLQISLCTFGCLYATSNTALAQVTSDGTVNTQVNQNGNVAEITGGETRGSNLFHSFQDFSVPTGNEAFFNNADSISNIFSRVTGGNISNIDGLIRANGSADLFLINPAGIIFGENARLDIGGSFLGTTATSILFDSGEFSAADLENPPLLTINAPIGLGFRDEPQPITNQSVANGLGLQVDSGQNFTLVGGDIDFNTGIAIAAGGRIELGSLSESGIVNLNEDFSVSFPENIARADINFTNGAFTSVASEEGGSINLNARNINFTGGSGIVGGLIATGINVPEAQAGNVIINATETITLDGINTFTGSNSGIFNNVESGAVGNAGDVQITSKNLSLTNGAQIQTIVRRAQNFNGQDLAAGNGIAGDITLNIEEAVTVSGVSETFNVNGQDSNSSSLISSSLDVGATGESGTISIASGSLNLNGGGRVFSSTFGTGNAGQITLDVDTLSFDGGGEDIASQTVINSGVYSTVELNGVGNAGGIDITTNELSLTNGGVVNSSTFRRGDAGVLTIDAGNIFLDGVGSNGFSSGIFSTVNQGGEGNAGGIDITTNELSLTNGGVVNGSTFGRGNAGVLTIDAGNIFLDGVGSNGFSSGIFSAVALNAEGNAGKIDIETSQLSLDNLAEINSSTSGKGDAGNVEVNADNSVSLSNNSFIRSTVGTGAEGDGGDIDLEANSLTLTEGSQIQTGVFGTENDILGGIGDAGDINLKIHDTLTASGFNETEMGRFSSGIFSTINSLGATGEGGEINIVADSISLTDSATFNAANFGEGNAGQLSIQSNSLSLDNNARIDASTVSEEGGNINLQIAEDITLENNSFISAQAFGNANGGNLTIDARFVVAFPSSGTGNDLVAAANLGEGGNINLDVEQLFGLRQGSAVDRQNNTFTFIPNNTNDIDISGNIGGSLNINTRSVNPLRGTTELAQNPIEPQQTIAQVCQTDRETVTNSNLTVSGKGGIIPESGQPLNSLNVSINGEINPTSAIPAPIETSLGKIQPARGIKVSEDGKITLTAYRTNNSGDRLPEIKPNCS